MGNRLQKYINSNWVDITQFIKGDKGATGQDGADSSVPGPIGEHPDIQVDSTTTLPPGEDAYVVLGPGTTQDITVLDFGIPKGETGAQGVPGPHTAIEVDSTTTLPPGSAATVTEGPSSNTNLIKLDFGIPEGIQGIQGEKGDRGEPTDVQVDTTTTLPPGQDAYVILSPGSTPDSIVLDFGIPQGEKGDTGDPGTQVQVGTTTTLNPGEDAYVDVDPSSTAELIILNFGIPRG